jgi:hypothetical protein
LVNATKDALEPGRHYNRIVMDLSGLRRVTPTGLAMLASVMLLLRDRGSFETGRYARPRETSMDQLLSSLGFYGAITDPQGGFDRAATRMREHGGLVNVTEESQCDRVAGWLADFVCAKLTQCADLRSVLQFCLSELMKALRAFVWVI